MEKGRREKRRIGGGVGCRAEDRRGKGTREGGRERMGRRVG